MRQGGGIGDVMNLSVDFFRWFVDTSYFIIVILMLLNIIFGIIIDTFSSLRNNKNARLADTEGVCFICGISKQTFDRASDKPDGFKTHVKLDHNMWNYLYFIFFLWEQDKDDDDGLEQYVRRAIEADEITWFPQNKAIRLDQAASEEEMTFQEISSHIKEIDENLSKKLANLQTELNVMLDQITLATRSEANNGPIKDSIAAYLKANANIANVTDEVADGDASINGFDVTDNLDDEGDLASIAELGDAGSVTGGEEDSQFFEQDEEEEESDEEEFGAKVNIDSPMDPLSGGGMVPDSPNIPAGVSVFSYDDGSLAMNSVESLDADDDQTEDFKIRLEPVSDDTTENMLPKLAKPTFMTSLDTKVYKIQKFIFKRMPREVREDILAADIDILHEGVVLNSDSELNILRDSLDKQWNDTIFLQYCLASSLEPDRSRLNKTVDLQGSPSVSVKVYPDSHEKYFPADMLDISTAQRKEIGSNIIVEIASQDDVSPANFDNEAANENGDVSNLPVFSERQVEKRKLPDDIVEQNLDNLNLDEFNQSEKSKNALVPDEIFDEYEMEEASIAQPEESALIGEEKVEADLMGNQEQDPVVKEQSNAIGSEESDYLGKAKLDPSGNEESHLIEETKLSENISSPSTSAPFENMDEKEEVLDDFDYENDNHSSSAEPENFAVSEPDDWVADPNIIDAPEMSDIKDHSEHFSESTNKRDEAGELNTILPYLMGNHDESSFPADIRKPDDTNSDSIVGHDAISNDESPNVAADNNSDADSTITTDADK